MSMEYLDAFLGSLPTAVAGAAAASLGQPLEGTEQAISLSKSAILGSLLSAAKVPATAEKLLPHLLDAASEIPRLSNLANVYQGQLEATSLGALAKTVLQLLFGDSLAGLVQKTAQTAGISAVSTASIFEMAATHLLPSLGIALKASHNTTPAGLLMTMTSVAPRFSANVPDWLSASIPAFAAPVVGSVAAAAQATLDRGTATVSEYVAPSAAAIDAARKAWDEKQAQAAAAFHEARAAGAKAASDAIADGQAQVASTNSSAAASGEAAHLSFAERRAQLAAASEAMEGSAPAYTGTPAATTTTTPQVIPGEAQAAATLAAAAVAAATAASHHARVTAPAASATQPAPLHPADEILAPTHGKIADAIEPITARETHTSAAAVPTVTHTHAHGGGAKTEPAHTTHHTRAEAVAAHRAEREAAAVARAAEDRDRRNGAGWLWTLPALLLLGTAGWWLWEKNGQSKLAGPPAAPVHAQASAPPAVPQPDVKKVEAEVPPPAAADNVETAKVEPGHTDYYGSTSTFSAEVWSNPDYTAAEAETALPPAEPVETAQAEPAAEAVAPPEETLADPVPGHSELYDAGQPFTADVWTNPDYAAAEEVGPVDTAQAETATEPVPAAEETLADPVPGHTELYEAGEPFTAEVWTNPDYAAASDAAAEPAVETVAETLAEPVPGVTQFYGDTQPFSAEVWSNPNYSAAQEPEPVVEAVAAPVPGRTDFYGASQPFTADVWTNPDYGKTTVNVAAAPHTEAAVKCQSTLNASLSPVLFMTARSDLLDEGRKALDRIAQAIKSCPSAYLRVEGHTDSDGDTDLNQSLSEDRAQAVVEYLAAAGVEAGHLKAVGFGETKPVAANDTDENKARNRRIEFIVEDR